MANRALGVAAVVVVAVALAQMPVAAETLSRDAYVKAWVEGCRTERLQGGPIAFSSGEADAIRVFIHIGLRSRYDAVKAFGGAPTGTLDHFVAEACTCTATKLAARGGDLRKAPATARVLDAARACSDAIRMLPK